MKDFENHQISEILPLFDSDELKKLAEDIKQNGLQNPITLFEGKILDGRNRYAACRLAGVEPTVERYSGSKPLQYVISQNLHRRHLSEGQRAAIANEIARIATGVHKKTGSCSNSSTTQPEAAKLLNVSRNSVQCVRRIEKNAPEILKEIKNGTKTINEAMMEINEKNGKSENKRLQNEAASPNDDFPIVVDKGRKNAFRRSINAINELKGIPHYEPARPEALQSVVDWIIYNKHN
jgi:ParB-like chromosome segregation protein Spo0J